MSDLRKLLEVTTPGPWIERWDEDGGAFVTGNNYVRADMVGPHSNRRANARLIALAPDLAAALLKAEEALAESANELDAYYAHYYSGDHPYSVKKLEQAKASNPARVTLTEIRKLTGGK